MHPLATTAQMKELDRRAIQKYGILSLDLMERAALSVSERVLKIAEGHGKNAVPRAAVFCGPGNNGGDGIAAARLLIKQGFEVRTFLIGNKEKITADAKAMEERLLAAGGKLEPFAPDKDNGLPGSWLNGCVCLVDALFGVGLKRPVAGDFLTAVQQINESGCPVVACDIPSGIDGDTGMILGAAVRADWTVTFTCGKPGLYKNDGKRCAGNIEIADIGIPDELILQTAD
ncbi:MAG: NAD(P)H-hydrate epimerase [Lachnospiraceae bacterium]